MLEKKKIILLFIFSILEENPFLDQILCLVCFNFLGLVEAYTLLPASCLFGLRLCFIHIGFKLTKFKGYSLVSIIL